MGDKGRLAVGVLLSLAAVMLLAIGGGWFEGAPVNAGYPQAENAAAVTRAVWTLYPQTAKTGSGTVYSDAPNYWRGYDRSDLTTYETVDIFATIDISGSGYVTVTPQFSADQSNWVDATRTAEGFVLPLSYSNTLTNSSGVTNTTTSTATTSFSGSSGTRVTEEVTYEAALTADGTDYVADVPTVGQYMRLKIEYSGTVTITSQAVFKR